MTLFLEENEKTVDILQKKEINSKFCWKKLTTVDILILKHKTLDV